MKAKTAMLYSIGVLIVILAGIFFYKFSQRNIVFAPAPAESEKLTTMTVKVVAYCPCAKCNKQWAGLVCTGHKMKEFTDKGIDICAVDPTVIPLGSIIYYDAKNYLAADVGSKIKGNIIDILVATHEDTIKFGVKNEQIIEVKKSK